LIFSVLWWKIIKKVPYNNTAEWFLSAGRNMKGGIVTASIVSTWTWAATIMVSSKMGYIHGISGPYWYAAGATIPILLFSVIAVYLKKLAPQVHTFPEFILSRYDKKTSDIKAWCEKTGNELLKIDETDGEYHAYVRKLAPDE
jgi:Na+/proline symporter